MMHPSRRDLLRAASVAPFVPSLLYADSKPAFPGLIIRQSEPLNLEMPFASLDDWTVPNERFYVRNHFAMPKVDAKSFRLTIEGHVENKLELTLDEVKKIGSMSKPLLLECAGNGRVFLTPPARGLQWTHGAVGNADWTGVNLSEILDRVKPKAGATDVVLIGADTGAITADPATPGAIHFSRSLPIAKAKKSEVMIAWGMNGEDLPPAHGFPLRAIVGGWYGMASVKWLTRIVVTDKPYQGYFQTMDYSYYVRRVGSYPEVIPVTEILPKAVIARPALDEVVPAGKPFTVHGAAWAGESPVAKVEVSTDGGKTWNAAKLSEKPKPFCWVKWQWGWTPGEKGRVKLIARSTDEAGGSQPEKRDTDRRSYAINHLVPVDLLVR